MSTQSIYAKNGVAPATPSGNQSTVSVAPLAPKKVVKVQRKYRGKTAAPDTPASREGMTRTDFHNWSRIWIAEAERNMSPGTHEVRRWTLSQFNWWLETTCVRFIDKAAVDGFMEYMASPLPEGVARWGNEQTTQCARKQAMKTLTATTRRNYYKTIAAFFSWCVKLGYIDKSPAKNVELPREAKRRIHGFSDADIKALIRAAEQGDNPVRDAAILYLMLDTGLRAAETCGVLWRDVDQAARRITVMGKGSKERIVYFSPDTAKLIKKYHDIEQHKEAEPLFLSRYEDEETKLRTGLTVNGLQNLYRRLGEKADLEKVRCSPHTMRHTFALICVRAGLDVFRLQDLMGHTNIQMTRRYVTFTPDDLAKGHASASPVKFIKLGKTK